MTVDRDPVPTTDYEEDEIEPLATPSSPDDIPTAED